MTKMISTLFIGLLLLTAMTYKSTETPTLVLKAEVSRTDDSGQCMHKKISSKPSLTPHLKCRFS